jgi:SOS response regulatory protein OraA/RecX
MWFSWFSAPIPSDAPINDLKLYKQLLNYKNIDTTIADTALEKLRKHFWYISPELVPLALFSKKVSIEDKKKIQRAILKYGDFLLQ